MTPLSLLTLMIRELSVSQINRSPERERETSEGYPKRPSGLLLSRVESEETKVRVRSISLDAVIAEVSDVDIDAVPPRPYPGRPVEAIPIHPCPPTSCTSVRSFA